MIIELKQWLSVNIPEIVDDLNEPATSDEIGKIENQLGVALPEDFKDMYLEHNGQSGEGDIQGVFYGLSFLSLEDVNEELIIWAEIVDSGMNDDVCSKSHVSGMIKENYANKLWIPFAYDGGGNILGLDLDPGEKGTIGQVINFGADEDTKYVLASSFSKFMAWYVKELEKGNYRIKDQGFHTKKPPTEHFLDSVKVMFR